MASTYVPLDSWVYSAFDRLAALGYVQTDFVALRPWTRMECARLVVEAEDRAADGDQIPKAAALYRSLSTEFALELRQEEGAANSGMQIESIYSQMVNIYRPAAHRRLSLRPNDREQLWPALWRRNEFLHRRRPTSAGRMACLLCAWRISAERQQPRALPRG